MVKPTMTLLLLILGLCAAIVFPQSTSCGNPPGKTKSMISFKDEILPIIKRQCLPCHAEDNFNPSELSLDAYELLMAGGKHGVPVVPGRSRESLLFKKIGPTPPFGDRMPLRPKKKKGETSLLSQEEIDIIGEWIDQGSRNN